MWTELGNGWVSGWLVADREVERPYFGMEMGTAERGYDKISDFHADSQGLFGHLLRVVLLPGLPETHGKSTCTHYFWQHTQFHCGEFTHLCV